MQNTESRTRQGVRDLNPPRNGKRPNCQCQRDPQTATRVEQRIRTVITKDLSGAIIAQEPKSVGVHICVFCGIERFSEHDEDQ